VRALLDRPRADTPIPYVGRAAMSWLTREVNRSDTVAQLSVYESVSTLHAIVSRIMTAVASVEWTLYRLPRSGDPEGRKPVTGPHPIKSLLHRPNPFQNGQAYTMAQQQHEDLAGESCTVLYLHPTLGVPVERWLARPDRMTPNPHPTKFIDGWCYRSPDGEEVELTNAEVVQVKAGPHPMSPYRGLSAVPPAMIDLEAWDLAARWNLNFFHNSAQPGGIIESPRELTDGEFDKFTKRWREQHRGVANAHRVAILEGMKWVDRSYSPKDMEFVSLRGFSSETIREAFGFPKPMLGGTEDVNKAAAWAAQTIFARWLVKPRLEIKRSAWNEEIIPLFGPLGDRMVVDFANPIPEDREDDDRERTSKSTAVSQLVAAGAYLPDALDAYGLPPMRRTAEVEADTEPDPTDPDEPAEPDEDPTDPTDPPAPMPEGDPTAPATPREVDASQAAKVAQQVYLAVGKVLTVPEAREVIRQASGLSLEERTADEVFADIPPLPTAGDADPAPDGTEPAPDPTEPAPDDDTDPAAMLREARAAAARFPDRS